MIRGRAYHGGDEQKGRPKAARNEPRLEGTGREEIWYRSYLRVLLLS